MSTLQQLKLWWTHLLGSLRALWQRQFLMPAPAAEELEEVPPVPPQAPRPPITFTRPAPKLPPPTPTSTPAVDPQEGTVFADEQTVASVGPTIVLTAAELDGATALVWIPPGTTQIRVSPRYRPMPKASRREVMWRAPGQIWSRMELIPVKATTYGEIFPVTMDIQRVGVMPGSAIEVIMMHGDPDCMMSFSVEFLFL